MIINATYLDYSYNFSFALDWLPTLLSEVNHNPLPKSTLRKKIAELCDVTRQSANRDNGKARTWVTFLRLLTLTGTQPWSTFHLFKCQNRLPYPRKLFLLFRHWWTGNKGLMSLNWLYLSLPKGSANLGDFLIWRQNSKLGRFQFFI